MTGPWYSRNGELRPVEEAVVSLDDVNFTYGYGVYETLKVRNGLVYFVDDHVERLVQSARIIDLKHPFDQETLCHHMLDLVRANGLQDANLKVLLIGRNPERKWGEDGEQKENPKADLYIMALNPLFPSRKDFKTGTSALVFCSERSWPMAKSLNMLASTIAFREARDLGAHDAILMDRRGMVREGTRTNLFYTDGSTIFTPPSWTVLEGVTRKTILQCCREKGYRVREEELALSDLFLEDERGVKGLFLSSTSTKIMPISTLLPARGDGPGSYQAVFGLDGGGVVPWAALRNSGTVNLEVPEIIRSLMKDYDVWLENWAVHHQ